MHAWAPLGLLADTPLCCTDAGLKCESEESRERMRKLIIVKVGSTMPLLASCKGDFEDWILAGLGIGQEDAQVTDVRNGDPLPKHDSIAGIVVTGSHAMVTEHHEWSERTAVWLACAVEQGIPALGICYGHQLLAYAMGGQVGDNPAGREFGTIAVHLEREASGDALLKDFTSPITVHVSHTQSVLRLPEKARRLAYSDRDANQAFVLGDRAWGVQFHPEFDAEVVRAYIEAYQDVLRLEAQSPETLLANSSDTPYGHEILKRFAAQTCKRS